MKKINHEQVNKVVNYVGTCFGTMVFGACLVIGICYTFTGLVVTNMVLGAIVAGATAYNLYDIKKYEEE